MDIFGTTAISRIEACINWALLKTQKEQPFLLQVEIFDPRTSKKELKSDFRHTLALSIILSMSHKKPTYLNEYIKYTLNLQRTDGGWPPGTGITISEVFTVSYAIELLVLNLHNDNLDHKVKDKLEDSIVSATNWLINNTTNNMLWESGVLKKEYPWDAVVTTAWMLRRLLPLNLERFSSEWNNKINLIIQSLINTCTKDNIWIKSDPLQKFRVESRIAAAINEAINHNYCIEILLELASSYILDWKSRTRKVMESISFDNFDLSTALFLAKPLIGLDNLIKIKNKIININH